jgi:large subunit ribosomal protein L25
MGTSDSVVLEAEPRQANGSGEARRLRGAGKVPVVVYGKGRSDNLQVNAHDFHLMMHRHGEHQILDLVVSGKNTGKVLVKDVQHDAYLGHILHADLQAISMDEELNLNLPLQVVGEEESKGIKAGGVLELVVNDLEIACLPGNMVEDLLVDVTDLEIGDSVTAGDIKLPEGIKLVSDPEIVVLTIAQPRAEEEPSDAEGEEGAEGAEPAPVDASKSEEE